jgi:hypothetical protein
MPLGKFKIFAFDKKAIDMTKGRLADYFTETDILLSSVDVEIRSNKFDSVYTCFYESNDEIGQMTSDPAMLNFNHKHQIFQLLDIFLTKFCPNKDFTNDFSCWTSLLCDELHILVPMMNRVIEKALKRLETYVKGLKPNQSGSDEAKLVNFDTISRILSVVSAYRKLFPFDVANDITEEDFKKFASVFDRIDKTHKGLLGRVPLQNLMKETQDIYDNNKFVEYILSKIKIKSDNEKNRDSLLLKLVGNAVSLNYFYDTPFEYIPEDNVYGFKPHYDADNAKAKNDDDKVFSEHYYDEVLSKDAKNAKERFDRTVTKEMWEMDHTNEVIGLGVKVYSKMSKEVDEVKRQTGFEKKVVVDNEAIDEKKVVTDEPEELISLED